MKSLQTLTVALLTLTAGCGVFDGQRNDSPGGHNGNPTPPPTTQGQGAKSCSAASVQRIARPYYPDNATADTFNYAFEYLPATGDKPTVVYIPGGPGQAAIGEDAEWLKRLPNGYGLVLTDPRGVGCNAKDGTDDQYPADFYKTRYVADDINAAIKHLDLTNYFVYGISYGTAVATIAASKAEAGDAPAPHAVVLEGTLGRAMVGDEGDATYEKLDASPQLAQAFGGSTLPLGYSSSDWISVIHLGLMIGEIKLDGEIMDYLDRLTQLAISTDPTDQQRARKAFDSNNQDAKDTVSDKGADTFYAAIACREIWPALYKPQLIGGKLSEDTSKNLCGEAGLSLTEEKFDAARWPIKAPIYYFDGRNDPATPINLAQYHFQSETTSSGRQLAIVEGAGHNPLGLSLTDCSNAVWQAMLSGSGFKDALAGCGWTPGINLQTASGSTQL